MSDWSYVRVAPGTRCDECDRPSVVRDLATGKKLCLEHSRLPISMLREIPAEERKPGRP